MVIEGRIGLFMLSRKGHPGLDTVHVRAVLAGVVEAFGMGDAAPGNHPVDLARTNVLRHAQAVAMGEGAIIKVGHGRDADVRMRAHVHLARKAWGEVGRAHVIEEDIGSDRTAGVERQHAAHLESAAEVMRALVYDAFDHW